jgi:hypothetical protein
MKIIPWNENQEFHEFSYKIGFKKKPENIYISVRAVLYRQRVVSHVRTGTGTYEYEYTNELYQGWSEPQFQCPGGNALFDFLPHSGFPKFKKQKIDYGRPIAHAIITTFPRNDLTMLF